MSNIKKKVKVVPVKFKEGEESPIALRSGNVVVQQDAPIIPETETVEQSVIPSNDELQQGKCKDSEKEGNPDTSSINNRIDILINKEVGTKRMVQDTKECLVNNKNELCTILFEFFMQDLNENALLISEGDKTYLELKDKHLLYSKLLLSLLQIYNADNVFRNVLDEAGFAIPEKVDNAYKYYLTKKGEIM